MSPAPGVVRAAVASAPSAAALCGPATSVSTSSVEPPPSVEPVETTLEPGSSSYPSSSLEPVETASAPPGPPALAADVVVRSVERLSPSFVRVTLGGPGLADLGVDGFDTRFKLVLPGPSGVLPPVPDRVEDYWPTLVDLPSGVRPAVRTYTVRDVVRTPWETRLVVDLVVHDEDADHEVGPACRWALTARPGDTLQVVGPHRDGTYGGTEFDPAGRRRLLVVGDATAVPAVARILADLGPGHVGSVLVEVPTAADVPVLAVPPGIEVHTCVRGAAPGARLVQEVRRHLGLPADPTAVPSPSATRRPVVDDGTVDVWETPRFSASGESLDAGRATDAAALADTYAWIAGESWMVRTLRRTLVGELGLDRAQVAFMGYWRDGVAMR